MMRSATFAAFLVLVTRFVVACNDAPTEVDVVIQAAPGVKLAALWGEVTLEGEGDGAAGQDGGGKSTDAVSLSPTLPATWHVRTGDVATTVRVRVTARDLAGALLFDESTTTTRPHAQTEVTLTLGESSTPPPDPSWTPVAVPTTEDLRAIWGSGDVVYVSGAGGVIFQGAAPAGPFTPMATNTTVNLTTMGGYGDLVVAAGGTRALGLTQQGTTWTPMLFPSAFNLVTAVVGTPTSGQYLADRSTNASYIWRATDGLTWMQQLVDLPPVNGLAVVSSAVYAVGESGVILKSVAEATWTAEVSGSTAQLFATWGAAQSDVYAVGGEGTILHGTGSAWAPVDSGVSSTLYSVWGSGPGDVYVVGAAGVVLHSIDHGVSWIPSAATTRDLFGVWGNGRGDVFVAGAGGTLLHHQE